MFGAADEFVSCHVLYLSYVVCFEPVDNNRLTDVLGVFKVDFGVLLVEMNDEPCDVIRYVFGIEKCLLFPDSGRDCIVV